MQRKNTTDEMMLKTNIYGEIFHNHRDCQDMRTDGTSLVKEKSIMKRHIINGTEQSKKSMFNARSLLP